MKARWIILSIAGAAVVATWSAAAIAYFFFDPSMAVWAALVTAGALSLEAFCWVGAGVLGWSFLAGRRAMLARLKQRFFADKPQRGAE
jgi:hypothetical protein